MKVFIQTLHLQHKVHKSMKTKKGKRAAVKRTRQPARRKYITDPAAKLAAGKPWTMHFNIDPDVAENLIAEKEGSTTGAEYGRIINAHLRAHYSRQHKKTA